MASSAVLFPLKICCVRVSLNVTPWYGTRVCRTGLRRGRLPLRLRMWEVFLPVFNRTSADGYLPVKPSSYLVLSIICTILCCLPAGIVAIVYSCKVNSLWDSGQYAKATAASRNALTWILVSAGVSLAWIVLSVALKLSFLPYAVLMN